MAMNSLHRGLGGGAGPSLPHMPLSRTTVDRAADRRWDETWLAQAWADPRSRVLVVDRGRALVDAADRLVLCSPADAPRGETYLLGVEAGQAHFAVVGALPDPPTDARVAGLREVGALLNDRDAGLMVHAVALQRWHATHQHCPRCGAATVMRGSGHMRVCPADDSQHFPRMDPAVIMLVRDEDDRCLLARKPDWPQQRRSVLAGFVEPGESLEQAVAREVSEEVGLYVAAPRYVASQPWPFPSNLMLGFMAWASGQVLDVDEEEIAAAQWFTRRDLQRAAGDGSVLLPPATSIARQLIETWYGGALPSAA